MFVKRYGSDVTLAGSNLIPNEELYDANYNLSDTDLDNNFNDILLEKD